MANAWERGQGLDIVSWVGPARAAAAASLAKGTGYLAMLNKGINEIPWIAVESKMLTQADSQVKASAGRDLEWYFAEREVANRMRMIFADAGLPIRVVYLPWQE